MPVIDSYAAIRHFRATSSSTLIFILLAQMFEPAFGAQDSSWLAETGSKWGRKEFDPSRILM
jgi:hypothetical protein